MKIQRVSDWMTTNPLTIPPSTTLPHAQQLMMENNVRRLPVVWRGKLIGILTFGDIREAKPSDATSLSVYELNYLLDQLTVKDIMTPNPITVGPSSTVREAAQLMLDYKIGGIPVLDNGLLVGIITESDFCRLLVQESPSSTKQAITIEPSNGKSEQ